MRVSRDPAVPAGVDKTVQLDVEPALLTSDFEASSHRMKLESLGYLHENLADGQIQKRLDGPYLSDVTGY
ncbi:MAG: hypothetical protein IH961_07890 [Chloroflexi bacterium]|nr:hypothetical protein [Chloroflexota bacterium]